MSLEKLTQLSVINFPRPLTLRGIDKLFDYVSEKIPAETDTEISYKKTRNPFLLEDHPIQIKRNTSVTAIIRDTHEDYQVILSAYEDETLRIHEMTFLPEVERKNFKQEITLRKKVIRYIKEYFKNYL